MKTILPGPMKPVCSLPLPWSQEEILTVLSEGNDGMTPWQNAWALYIWHMGLMFPSMAKKLGQEGIVEVHKTCCTIGP